MRDAFGEVDPDEVDIIDLVEPDARAFSKHDDFDTPTHVGNRRRWVLPAAIASVAGVVAAGLIVWSPWSDDNTVTFPGGDSPELTLTERLVFGDPPAELTASSLGLGPQEDSLLGFGQAEGYFFAEPGASWDVLKGASTGVWAGFVAERADEENSQDVELEGDEPSATVQGTPARIENNVPGGGTEVRFGPVDGWMFSVISGGMSRSESLAFAEAVGVEDGLPSLSNESVTGEMLPVGSIADYGVAISTLVAASSPFGFFGSQPGIVSVHYGESPFDLESTNPPAYSIATQPVAGDTTLSLLQFVLGGEDGHTVHGQRAIVGDTGNEVDFGGESTSFVAWVEGGRIIVVTSPDDRTATLALAETVRPATDDEWDEVVAGVWDPRAFEDDFEEVDFSNGVTLYHGVDPGTGDTFSFEVELDASLMICIHEQTAEGSVGRCQIEPGSTELPLLWTGSRSGHSFVLAVVDRGLDAEAELRITLADGSTEIFPLVDHGDALPGPAVATLLPNDHGAVELVIGDMIVATL